MSKQNTNTELGERKVDKYAVSQHWVVSSQQITIKKKNDDDDDKNNNNSLSFIIL